MLLSILVLWVSGLAAAAQFAKFAVLFPDILALYPDHAANIGLLVSIISVLGIFLGLFAGVLVAKMGYRRLLLGALILGAAISFYQSTVPSFELVFVSRIIEGISHLVIVVAAPTLIAQLADDRFLKIAMTLWSTFFGVAFALVAWIAIPISTQHGPEIVFQAHGAIMVLVAIFLFFLLPPDRVVSGENSFQIGELITKHTEAYRSPNISAPALGWLFYTLTFVSLITVLPTIVPASERSFVAGSMPLASIAVAFLTGLLVLRWVGSVWAIMIGFAVSILVLLAIWSGAGIAVFSIVLFGTLGLVQGASFAAVPELNERQEDQALANGAMAQMGNMGNTLGTPMLLFVLSAYGVNGVLGATAFLYLVAIALHLYLMWVRSA